MRGQLAADDMTKPARGSGPGLASGKRMAEVSAASSTSAAARLNRVALQDGAGISVLKNSKELGWTNLEVMLVSSRLHDFEIGYKAVPNLWIAASFEPVDMSWIVKKREQRILDSGSRISVFAPGTAIGARRRKVARGIHVRVKRDVFAEVAGALFDREPDDFEIVTALGFRDSGLEWMLRSVKAALFEPAEHTCLKIDYLARALTAHVLRTRTAGGERRCTAAGGCLTAGQVRLITDHVIDRFAAEILLQDLAALVGLSRTVFIQRFKTSFRQTPHQYLMQVRIARAREALATTSRSIAEIALTCGFSDQAHLCCAFKQATGMTPLAFRRNSG